MDMTQSGTGSLVYATYFGGSDNDEVRKLALDANGNLLLTGYTLSSDFPVTKDAIQPAYGGNSDAFVLVVNPTNPAFLLYSSYLGGADGEVGFDIAADSAGFLYVTGYTLSREFSDHGGRAPTGMGARASTSLLPSCSGAWRGLPACNGRPISAAASPTRVWLWWWARTEPFTWPVMREASFRRARARPRARSTAVIATVSSW